MEEKQLTTLEIDKITEEILNLKQQTAQNIIEIGNRLIKIKSTLPHGRWGSYLKEKVDFSPRTAQNFMKVANEFSNPQSIADLGATKIFKLLDIKKDKREEFINKKHEVDGKEKTVFEMSTRELKKAIREHQKLEEKIKLQERKIKEIKENVLLNKEAKADMKVEFEEVITNLGSLDYKIYFIKNGIKTLIRDDYASSWFAEIDLTDKCNVIVSVVNRNKTLIHEEKEFILAECLRFKDTALKRKEEVWEQYKEESAKQWEEAFNGFFTQQQQPQLSISNKDTYKKFYRVLATNFHPDKGGTTEEMIVLNQLKESWGI